jgi:putative aminopeptidase FrvX
MSSPAETPELLDRLIRTPAPSGYETPAAEVWREAARAIDGADLRTDTLGSSVVEVSGGEEAAPRLAIVGHIDEIGLHVTYIDDDGFLWFGPIGGWDPQILVGQRVTVIGFDGEVPGVLGKKPIHLLKDEARKKPAKLEEMHIDIGAADREEAEKMVRIGDVAVLAAEPVSFPNGRLVSRSLDNRLGSYVALETAKRVAAKGDSAAGVIGAAVAQEEITFGGSRTTAFSLDPDVAVVVDVTHATDAPGIDKKEQGDHPLGSGPVIGRGSTLNHHVCQLLVETAEAEGIDHTIEASGRYTGTDADAIQIARAGIPCGLVSLPLRYMHSSVEMVQLSDVEAAIELLVAFAGRLGADSDFSR